jgi:hypothetical protein
MNSHKHRLILLYSVIIVSLLGIGAVMHSSAEEWPLSITKQQKPGTYWWCPGSAWDRESIDWNLQNLKEGGIGTVHIVPIYGARGYEDREIPYLSEKWLESLQYILQKAKSLDLQVDMTTGTGWCFGGPGLESDHFDTRASYDENSKSLKFNTRRMVKRAGPGGAGHMLNPFSIDAINAYTKTFDTALESCELLPRAQYHDSFEYAGNWSVTISDEFKKRRGYDLEPHIASIFGNEDSETARRLKYDYRLTAAELHREFIQKWSDWANSRGMITRNQAHGSPTNLLDVYAAADIPETEMFGSPEFPIPRFRHEEQFCRPGDTDPRICKMASSAAHVAHQPGKQLVSSESCTWMREHWHGTLSQIKLQIDLFFLAGVNHMFYHGSCYSPKDAPWPGFFFYASTKADWRNSIWRDMPYLNQYIARCQSVLQAGQPANDILVYWPIHDMWMDANGVLKNLTVHSHGWMEEYILGSVANQLDQQGYSYDFISDRLLNRIQVNDKQIVAPGGTYKAIVIPSCEYMPLSTMKRLLHLSKMGGTIVFDKQLPNDVAGYKDIDQRRKELSNAKDQINSVVTISDNYVHSLKEAGIDPESLVQHGLKYIRRNIDGEYWYFIVNHSANDFSGWISLNVPYTSALFHNPMNGESFLLPTRKLEKERHLYIDMAAGDTWIVQACQSQQKAKPYIPMKATDRTAEINGEWKVEFIEGGPELPKAYTTKSLTCWTNAPDEKSKAFAGTARYTGTFNKPNIGQADEYCLDLGDVRESARVKVNGNDVAVLFALPMRTRIGRYLKEGSNTIEIEVTNLAANRIRDLDMRKVDWQNMHDINIVNQHYQKFDGTKWPLQPSGLLGPVTLTAMKKTET